MTLKSCQLCEHDTHQNIRLSVLENVRTESSRPSCITRTCTKHAQTLLICKGFKFQE